MAPLWDALLSGKYQDLRRLRLLNLVGCEELLPWFAKTNQHCLRSVHIDGFELYDPDKPPCDKSIFDGTLVLIDLLRLNGRLDRFTMRGIFADEQRRWLDLDPVFNCSYRYDVEDYVCRDGPSPKQVERYVRFEEFINRGPLRVSGR